MREESSRRWSHYTTDALERLLREVEEQNGGTLAGLLAEIKAELEWRGSETGSR